MKSTPANCAYRHTTDIAADARANGAVLSDLANACLIQATTALENDPSGRYGDLQRGTVANLLTGMQSTHRNIRRLLSEEGDEPAAVERIVIGTASIGGVVRHMPDGRKPGLCGLLPTGRMEEAL